jgi:hypothetical protein
LSRVRRGEKQWDFPATPHQLLFCRQSFEEISHSILKHWQFFLFFLDETYQVGDKAQLTLTVSISGVAVMSAQNEAIV